jgi:hypothetical protein
VVRKHLETFLVLIALSLHFSASGFDFYPVNETDKNFLAEIVDAVRRNDADWISNHMVYPLSIVARNKTHLVKTKEEFASVLSLEFTKSVQAKIVKAASSHSSRIGKESWLAMASFGFRNTAVMSTHLGNTGFSPLGTLQCSLKRRFSHQPPPLEFFPVAVQFTVQFGNRCSGNALAPAGKCSKSRLGVL